ncbi:hypothetical protein EII29_11635, partial [Leptotrichia sp. OH3620_COT-345]|uniref:hypothetical protein n=1 Tax=Leptotrichia sp. OH3620_COT-345 TaxID=2491048 RepID=UPI000FB60715
MKEFLLQIVNGAGQNALNLIGVTVGTYLIAFLSKRFVKFYKFLIERKITKLITKYIPAGIAYGEILKGTKPNSEVLFQAILRVQNLVLKVFPEKQRPMIAKMLDPKKIADGIERALNE